MNDKIKKYILPNIPYLFALWVCVKLGTAYRLADGIKLIGILKTTPAAFGTIAPGLVGFDWLVGIIGAALLRAIVYCRIKKVKNSERMWNTVRRVGERKKT